MRFGAGRVFQAAPIANPNDAGDAGDRCVPASRKEPQMHACCLSNESALGKGLAQMLKNSNGLSQRIKPSYLLG